MTTHQFTQEQLTAAYKKVADYWRESAHAIRNKDLYASHVTEERKIANLVRDLAQADDIERGVIKSFAMAQRVEEALTGTCTPFLPKRA
jgi:hypothetical protein